jgi:hypothetical protein
MHRRPQQNCDKHLLFFCTSAEYICQVPGTFLFI